ncbi:Predicted arabinose efflux permease, MFS family [Franzmannia pantelleriensis]|uniref:Predicted arabinose efflux permease, MFS family n=1 Tax=Franzmannia pantelleriensis TaxID=48727 RepID=A0A1G9H9D3_9GAMM|nr:MFS transporter [Halomonas pantelleriensis]SDL09588.1 Predicted arabinose efflux permease, MFS family [Halomonas pantelleriensis]
MVGAAPSTDAGWGEGKTVLLATTWVQTLCSAAMLLVPTLAPQIAAAFGLPTGLVGLQVSLLYGVAMLVSLQAGVVARRLGACRASQLAMLVITLGCAVALLQTPLSLFATTLLLGVAYGMTNPAAAQLLARYTPAPHRNMVYSIKQTGVPLGGILAGIAAPPLTQAWSWHVSFLLLGCMSVLTALWLQSRQPRWDRHGEAATSGKGNGSLALLYRRRSLRWMGLAGFCLAAAQLSLISFAVAFMVEELTITLVMAGIVVSVMHAAGVAGRLGWGFMADRLGASLPVLIGLSIGIAVLFSLLALTGTHLPQWLVVVLLVLAGATAIGWNGVYLAEVARTSVTAEVSEATAAVLVLTYMGVLAGPACVALLVWLSGSYAISLLLPALAAVMAVFCLRRCGRVHHQEQASWQQ